MERTSSRYVIETNETRSDLFGGFGGISSTLASSRISKSSRCVIAITGTDPISRHKCHMSSQLLFFNLMLEPWTDPYEHYRP